MSVHEDHCEILRNVQEVLIPLTSLTSDTKTVRLRNSRQGSVLQGMKPYHYINASAISVEEDSHIQQIEKCWDNPHILSTGYESGSLCSQLLIAVLWVPG